MGAIGFKGCKDSGRILALLGVKGTLQNNYEQAESCPTVAVC